MHAMLQILFVLFIVEEFLNSFIDVNRYTPYTYIYTNNWIRKNQSSLILF